MFKSFGFNWQTFYAGIGFLLCLCLLVLSVPRLIGSLYALYPQATLNQSKSQQLSVDIYSKSIDYLDKALFWDNNPEYWQNKSLLYFALSNDLTISSQQRQIALLNAEQAVSNGLQLSPIDPYSWYRLGTIKIILGSSVNSINDALRLSLYSGRVEPDLIMPRLIMGLAYFNQADQELQSLLIKQIPLAWQFKPNLLVNFVLQNPSIKPLVDSAFMFDDDKLIKFNNSFEKAIKKNIPKKAG